MKGFAGIKVAFVLVLFLVAVTFMLQNTGVVDITFLFWQFTLSRVLVIIGSLTVGLLIGIILGWDMFGRRPKKKKKEKEAAENPQPL